MDIYYEQNVVNHNIDDRTKKTKTLNIARMICLVLGLFILISSALLITLFWVFLLASLPFFAAYILMGRINKRNNTEYDYVIDGEFIIVSEIYFRERRKQKYKIRLRLVESVGVFDTDGYKKVERLAVKKRLALVNYEDEQSILYILYGTDKGKQLIFLEPDRGFMIALRRCVSAITVFDKSINDLEKRLSQKESEMIASDKTDKTNISMGNDGDLNSDERTENSDETKNDSSQTQNDGGGVLE